MKQSIGELEDSRIGKKQSARDHQSSSSPILESSPSLYEIICGERRYRAAALLKWETIACFVYPADTPALETELLSLVENLQRVDLNPVEEARGYRQLIEEYRLTQSEVAAQVGKRQSAISEALSLLTLAPETLGFIERSIISRGHARVLAKITNVERQIDLARQAAAEGWSVKRLEEEIRAGEGNSKKEATSKPPRSIGDIFRALNAPDAPPPDVDPLEGLWDHIKEDEIAKSVDWQVQYHQKQWFFAIKRPEGSEAAEQTMARWAKALWRWLQPHLPEEKMFTEEAATADAQMMKDAGLAPIPKRLPKTDAEMAELLRLAESGPQAVYAWLFGPDSPTAQSIQNVTWKDLGAPNPTAAVRDLVKQLKTNAPHPKS